MTLDLTKLDPVTLRAVRQALGDDDGEDVTKDPYIANMTPREYIGLYAQWWLGDRSWGWKLYNLSHEADAAVVPGT